MVEKAGSGLADVGRDLGQPDGGFHRLDLAEKGADGLKGVVSPVLEQPGGFRGNLPGGGVRPAAPGIDLAAQVVDDRDGIVLLTALGEGVVHKELLLHALALVLLRLGDGDHELGDAAGWDGLLGRLPLVVQFPVLGRVGVGGVEDGVGKESIIHGQPGWAG